MQLPGTNTVFWDAKIWKKFLPEFLLKKEIFQKYWPKLDFSFENIVPLISSIPVCRVWRLVQIQVCGFWFLPETATGSATGFLPGLDEPGPAEAPAPLRSCGCYFLLLRMNGSLLRVCSLEKLFLSPQSREACLSLSFTCLILIHCTAMDHNLIFLSSVFPTASLGHRALPGME